MRNVKPSISAAIVVGSALAVQPVLAQQPVQPQAPVTREIQALPSFGRLVDSVKAAVVNVDVQSRVKGLPFGAERFGSDLFEHFFGGPRQQAPAPEGRLQQGAGSGFLIDPKGLIGPRGFDYGNIFANPDLDAPEPPLAVRPEVFARRLGVVTARAGLERAELLDWIVAVCGLSAAWFLADGMPAAIDLAVVALAVAARDA